MSDDGPKIPARVDTSGMYLEVPNEMFEALAEATGRRPDCERCGKPMRRDFSVADSEWLCLSEACAKAAFRWAHKREGENR